MPKQTETTTNEAAEPKTPAEVIAALPEAQSHVFILLRSGLGSPVMAAGKTYEAMWAHAEETLRTPKQELLKHGYLFDHVTTGEAERLLA